LVKKTCGEKYRDMVLWSRDLNVKILIAAAWGHISESRHAWDTLSSPTPRRAAVRRVKRGTKCKLKSVVVWNERYPSKSD
jgi:hypothetical protein